MKKTSLLLSAALLAASASAAVNHVVPGLTVETGQATTMPIYSDELIDEAPAGTVMSGLIRKGFSYFYDDGVAGGGYNDSFVGEYVLGDDGNIYLKNPCASLAANTYMKLEPVVGSNEQYVAHTAQLIYVYDQGTSISSYFCTRMVFHKYTENSYGYIIEEGADGQAVTDIFFTYKDGVLKQSCQEIVELNGYYYPQELIGISTSTGGWIGFGDACLEIYANQETATVLPEGAEVKEMSFAFGDYSSKKGRNFTNAQLLKCAEVGDNFYLASPVAENMWIKGDIDRNAGTVTFRKQYLGENAETGVFNWFMPAYYNLWFDMWDEEEGYGVWMRDMNMAESYVCKYENGCLISDESLKQIMTISISDNAVEAAGAYADIVIRPYEAQANTPVAPTLVNVDPFNGMWGEFQFAFEPVDADKNYIAKEELYYSLYLGSEQPFEINNDYFGMWPYDPTYQVPFLYVDPWDFVVNSWSHLVVLYGAYEYMGVQAIHKFNGEDYKSEITWYNHTQDGLVKVEGPAVRMEGKRLENGRFVIVKNGRKYDAAGNLMK